MAEEEKEHLSEIENIRLRNIAEKEKIHRLEFGQSEETGKG